MFNKIWWRAAGIRVVRTVAQVFIAALTAMGAAQTSNIFEINWLTLLSVTTVAGLLAFASAVAGLPEVDLTNQRNSDI